MNIKQLKANSTNNTPLKINNNKVVAGTLPISMIEDLQNQLNLKLSGYDTLVGETGVLYSMYPPGDSRRYGIFPNTDIIYHDVHPTYLESWLNSAKINGTVAYLPPGTYRMNLQIYGSTYSNINLYFDNAILKGQFKILSNANPQPTDTKVSGIICDGILTVYDRLEFTMIEKCRFNEFRIVNNPSENFNNTGMNNRGMLIYFGCDDIQIERITIDETDNFGGTDAAINLLGNGNNPKNIYIKNVWIKGSKTHGMYITGLNHIFDDVRIDYYGIASAERAMQDSDGLAQSSELKGIWVNRATGTIKRLMIYNTYVGSRPNAKYDVMVDETDLSNSHEVFTFGEIIIENALVGTTNARGVVSFGDKNYLSSGQCNSIVRSMFITCNNTITLESGYSIVGVYQKSAGTYVSVTDDINIFNASTNRGILTQLNSYFRLGGLLNYSYSVAGLNNKGIALDISGFAEINGVRYKYYGTSDATTPMISWNATAGSKIGNITAISYNNTNLTKQVLAVNGASNTSVGPLYCSNFRSGSGVINVNNVTNFVLYLNNIDGGVAIANFHGMVFAGNITDCKIYNGRIENFDRGLDKGTATITRLSTHALVSINNTTNTNLLSSSVTTSGACLNVTV